MGQDSIFRDKTIWYSINQIIVENYEGYYQQEEKLVCQESIYREKMDRGAAVVNTALWNYGLKHWGSIAGILHL